MVESSLKRFYLSADPKDSKTRPICLGEPVIYLYLRFLWCLPLELHRKETQCSSRSAQESIRLLGILHFLVFPGEFFGWVLTCGYFCESKESEVSTRKWIYNLYFWKMKLFLDSFCIYFLFSLHQSWTFFILLVLYRPGFRSIIKRLVNPSFF